jgi:RimJ/RimL family protein N-acetyltransferase
MRGALDGKPGALSDSTRLAVTDRALETERLLLRRLSPADAAALHRCTGAPAVMRYWHPGPDVDVAATEARIAEIGAHWREHGFGDYGALARDSGELIGFAGLHHIAGMAEINLGYALVPARWRRGLGTELCAILLAHGFTDLGLPEIVAVIDPRNAASVALAARSGLRFRREATWQGQPRLVLALTRAEFEAGR